MGSLTVDEHRWCDWVKEREAAGVRPDVAVHSESVYAFTTGASRERARIRKELLALAETWKSDACVLGDRHGAGLEDAADLLTAALDRLCPAAAKEGE